MESPASPGTTTISVFTRHSPDCSRTSDRAWRRCKCRKALYIYEEDHDRIVSARTRSWEQAEIFVQTEGDRRDPVKRKLLEIAEEEARKAASRKVQITTVKVASDRWLAAQKIASEETAVIYKTAAKRINFWAVDQGVANVADITAANSDEWHRTYSEGLGESGKVHARVQKTRKKDGLSVDTCGGFFIRA